MMERNATRHPLPGTFKIAVLNSLVGYSAKVLRGITSYARPSKPWIIHFIRPSENALKIIADWKPDGILAELVTQEQAKAVCSLRKPVVNYAFKFNQKNLAQLGQDDDAIGRMAADYFLERGFRHFAYIGDDTVRFTKIRGGGFAGRVRDAGFNVSNFGDFLPRSQRDVALNWNVRDEHMRRWILSLPKPVAILAASDTWGWHVSEVCLTAGVHVPEEAALLGVDNDQLLCEMAWPPLSSVECHAERIGYRAAEILDQMIHGQKAPPEPIIFQPVRVVTRQSSDILAVSDPDVISALRYIREHASEPISVDTLAAETAISRRALERKFQLTLRRTPLEEIHRARIERAKTLLAETNLAIPQVGIRAGFQNRQRFGEHFKRHAGMTASQYRETLRQSPDK